MAEGLLPISSSPALLLAGGRAASDGCLARVVGEAASGEATSLGSTAGALALASLFSYDIGECIFSLFWTILLMS